MSRFGFQVVVRGESRGGGPIDFVVWDVGSECDYDFERPSATWSWDVLNDEGVGGVAVQGVVRKDTREEVVPVVGEFDGLVQMVEFRSSVLMWGYGSYCGSSSG
jgi:hypothetical protein